MQSRRCSIGLVAALALIAPVTPAQAQHRFFETSAGGGLSWVSPDPEAIDLQIGGQLSARMAVDVAHARGAIHALVVDPSRWDRPMVRAEGRLLFLAVQDFTWRVDSMGEVLRLQAGFGGEVDLPDRSGHLMLGTGFAMLRHSAARFSEAYGAYAGATLRLHLGPVTDELHFSVHAVLPPPQLSLTFSMDDLWASVRGGVTVGNRLYVHALSEGAFSLGPEIFVQVEQLLDGVVILSTLGLVAYLGA